MDDKIKEKEQRYNETCEELRQLLTDVVTNGSMSPECSAKISQLRQEEQLLYDEIKSMKKEYSLEIDKELIVNILTDYGKSTLLKIEDSGNVTIGGENIPKLNFLAQMISFIAKNNEEESKIELTPEFIELISSSDIKLKAKNINLEGLVTANENFKILEDGSIVANNGTFTGKIYIGNNGSVIDDSALSNGIRQGAKDGTLAVQKLETVDAEIGTLKADKADITDLNATNAVIENLKANKADVQYLTANFATIKQLDVTNANVTNLQANKADITDLNATNAEIENLKTNKADIATLNANVATINQALINKATVADLNAANAKIANLETGKADISVLEANYATIKQLNATNANVTSLQTETANINKALIDKADVADLNATNANVTNLQATKANITDLNAAKANINILTTNLAEITTLVNGNLTSDNIQSMVITGDKFTVADAFIKNAMIDSINASKINAGIINTNNVSIQSNDGSMVLQGNLQQFKDKNGKVRIQIGKDASGNFTFCLYDENGTGQLINQNGIQSSNAIADGLIVDSKVAANANIAGSKLDIDSVVTEVNNGSTNIKGTKIYLDDQNQTLDVAFNNMSTTVSGNTSTINNHTTSINTMNGKVTQLIADTTITKQDGTAISLKDAYNSTKDTVNSHTQKIGSLETNVSKISTGQNKWLLEMFEKGEGIDDISPITINDIMGKALIKAVLVDDSVTSNQSTFGNEYLGRATTYVYLDEEFNWETTATSDDGSTIYINGAAIATLGTCTPTAVTVPFKQGWNKITWVYNEGIGGDGWDFNPRLTTLPQIKYMNAYSMTNIDEIGNVLNSNIKTVSSRQATLEQDLNGFKTTVANTYATQASLNTVDGKFANYSTTSAMNSAINQKANEITSTVAETYTTKTEFNNLSIGGRNFVKNSNFAKGSTYWTTGASISDTILHNGHKSLRIAVSGRTDYGWIGASQTVLSNVQPNTTITVSCWYYVEDKSTFDDSFGFELKGEKVEGGGHEVFIGISTYSSQMENGVWKKIVATSTTDCHWNSLYIYPWVAKNGTVYVTDIKVELGNKATDWTPAPEDIDDSIAVVDNKFVNYSTTSQMNSAIEQKSNEINLNVSNTYATKTSVTDLSNNLSNNYSTTQQMNSAIDIAKSGIKLDVSQNYASKHEVAHYFEGENKWKLDVYSLGSMSASAYPTKETMIQNNCQYQRSYLVEHPSYEGDKYGDNYVGYATTYMHFTEAHQWNGQVVTDDAGNVYLNDVLVLSTPTCQWTNITLNFKAGWNKLEVLYAEGGGGDGWQFDSEIVVVPGGVLNKMNCYGQNSTEEYLKANYSTTQQMNSSIEQKANEITSSVSSMYSTKTETDDKIHNVRVGGTNLFKGTTNLDSLYWNSEKAFLTDSYYKGSRIYRTNAEWSDYNYPVSQLFEDAVIELWTEYTFSCYARSNTEDYKPDLCIYGDSAHMEGNGLYIGTVTTEWRQYSGKIKIYDGDRSYPLRIEPTTGSGDANKYIEVCGLQLEKGNKATDWSPSPRDTDVVNPNLIKNGRFKSIQPNAVDNVPDWTTSGGVTVWTSIGQPGYDRYGCIYFHKASCDGGGCYLYQDLSLDDIGRNVPLTLSFDAWREGTISEVGCNVEYFNADKSSMLASKSLNANDFNGHRSYTFVTLNDVNAKYLRVVFYYISANGATGGYLATIGNVKLEHGLCETAWSQSEYENMYAYYTTKSELQQTTNSITAKFSESGGYNLLRNSRALKGTSYWVDNGGGISVDGGNPPTIDHKYFCSNFPSGITYYDWIQLENNTHYIYSAKIYVASPISFSGITPLHYWCTADKTAGQTQVSIVRCSHDGQTIPAGQWIDVWVEYVTASSGAVWFKPFIYQDGSSCAVAVTDLMLCKGSIPSPWSPHPSEVYDGITQIDKDGIKVYHNNIDGDNYTHMAPTGFYLNHKGTDIFKMDGNGLYVKGNGEFTGKVTSTSGNIGGFDISQYNIKGTNVGMGCSSGHDYAFWAGASSGSSAPFHVGHDGSLTATNATITGTITGSTISGNTITGGTISGTEVTGGAFNVEGQLTANKVVCKDIDSPKYPGVVTEDLKLYVSIYGNDDSELEDGAVFASFDGLLDKLPKNLNGHEVRIEMATDITENVEFVGYHGGRIKVHMKGHALNGYANSRMGSARIFFYSGYIGNSTDTSNGRGKIHPNKGYAVGNYTTSVACEDSGSISLYNIDDYGADNYLSGSSNKVGAVATTWGTIYLSNVKYYGCDIGSRANAGGRVHDAESYGVCAKYGCQSSTGGYITLTKDPHAGGKTANYTESHAGKVIVASGATFATGDVTNPGGTAPISSSKTVTVKSTSGDTYRSTMYNSYKGDNTVRQGDYGYGNCNGIWLFGDQFDQFKGKNITKVVITINRQGGGQYAAVDLNIKTHNYKTRPSGNPSYVANVGTLGLAANTTGSKTITDTNNTIIAGLKAGTIKGIGLQSTYDSSHYAVCSGSVTIKVTYNE